MRRVRGVRFFSAPDEAKRLLRLSIEESVVAKRVSSAARVDVMTSLWSVQFFDDIKPSGLEVMSCFNNTVNRLESGANMSLSGWTRILKIC
jgi:hypothetical protein